MKLLICSDIHGDAESAKKVLTRFEEEGADKLIILGDILYHGPRNDLPKNYSPKTVIGLLNPYKEKILSVRGNCDSEVDQMVLDFPILAEYAYLEFDGVRIFVTHGHVHNTTTPPPLSKGEILLHGHTHIPAFIEFGNENLYINPGSASLPKEQNPKTYLIYENRKFILKHLNGDIIEERTV